jgi:hypothetical protein
MKGIWQPHESHQILADKEMQWTPEDIYSGSLAILVVAFRNNKSVLLLQSLRKYLDFMFCLLYISK